MLELLQITNDAAFARRCDALDGMRLFVDLERLGKAERQAGRNTFISTHTLDDVARIRDAARRSPLMVRVNPLHADSAAEIDAVLRHAPDLVMLPMAQDAATVQQFCALLAGRVRGTVLLETAAALASVDTWAQTPGLSEIYVGLNDLHLSMGLRFMFEPLAAGDVDRVAAVAHQARRNFGFGGIARLDEGLLPGRDVLAEHLRLGSRAVILSRTFHREDADAVFEDEVAALRRVESQLAARSPDAVEADRQRIAARIREIAAGLGAPGICSPERPKQLGSDHDCGDQVAGAGSATTQSCSDPNCAAGTALGCSPHPHLPTPQTEQALFAGTPEDPLPPGGRGSKSGPR